MIRTASRGIAAALALATAALALATAAPAMSVAEFLGRIDGLKAKGPLALFSSDIGVLKAEGRQAAIAWKAQAHRPNSCPPAGDLDMSQKEFLGYLNAVPPPKRATTGVDQAVTAGLNRRFPCRG